MRLKPPKLPARMEKNSSLGSWCHITKAVVVVKLLPYKLYYGDNVLICILIICQPYFLLLYKGQEAIKLCKPLLERASIAINAMIL